MAAATTRISWYGGAAAEPAGVTAEDNAGIVFNREDSKANNSVLVAVPIPLVAGTVYSWPKLVALEVMVAGTTTISNRRISLAAPPPIGVHWYVKAQAAYVQPSAAGMPADAATDAAVPAGYTEVTAAALVVFDVAAVSSAALGRNGGFAQVLQGIDSQYAANGGQAGLIPDPTYRLTYDEG